MQEFRHEALFYAGEAQFVDAAAGFVRDGLAAEEPVLVVVGAEKIALLRDELGRDADRVAFADMADVGANPARIIPAWRAFVDEHGGGSRPLRGIGEPIDADRTPAELRECHRHECLLNLAFVDTPGFSLLCPYDTTALDGETLAEATRHHPLVTAGGVSRRSEDYEGLMAAVAPFDEPLPDAAATPEQLPFAYDTLADVRRFVAARADAAGVERQRALDLQVAVHEAASNSIRHGGGRGLLRTWRQDGALICEVTDEGWYHAPLIGRERPGAEQVGGYGVWLVNQLCDLAQIRMLATGSVVRMHMRVGA